MTVGVVINCKDGIVIASDSLATFSRGAPVARHTNKVYIVQHAQLANPVVIAGAGMTAFLDKFVDRAKRDAIDKASKALNRKLDIVDFVERVAEPIVSFLLREYWIDRNKFFGTPIGEFSLAMLVSGATTPPDAAQQPELRAYTIYHNGVAEQIEGYGTIGSGAAYAELFLHGLVPKPENVTVADARNLICYTIKGVEIMDPNVGGETRVCTLKLQGKDLALEKCQAADLPLQARERMEEVLNKIGRDMQNIVSKPLTKPRAKKGS